MSLAPGATVAEQTDLMESEHSRAVAVSNNLVLIEIKPWEIMTIMVHYNHKEFFVCGMRDPPTCDDRSSAGHSARLQ